MEVDWNTGKVDKVPTVACVIHEGTGLQLSGVKAEVDPQILKDLQEAQELLKEIYLNARGIKWNSEAIDKIEVYLKERNLIN